jgi:hypothetical protein
MAGTFPNKTPSFSAQDMHMAQFLAMYGCTEVVLDTPSVWRKSNGFYDVSENCRFHRRKIWDFVGFPWNMMGVPLSFPWACQIVKSSGFPPTQEFPKKETKSVDFEGWP